MKLNKKLIRQKADVAVGDLASGGKLNPEQAATFIRKAIEQPTILRAARTVTMRSPERNINKIGFGSRILRPAPASGTALASNDRSKPNFEQVKLTTTELIAEVWLPYDVIEDNVERGGIGGAPSGDNLNQARGGIKDTIMTLMAEQVAADLEELALQGDTGSGDPFLATMDGWLKLSNVNVVDAANDPISKNVFKNGKKAMPSKYLRNLARMRQYVSVDNETEYRDQVADRQTGLGDSTITGRNAVFALGTPVEPVAFMPETQGLFTFPGNLIWGIQRDIFIEVDKFIRERHFVIVLTIRCDFKIEEPEAVVKYENIGVAA